MNGHGTDIRHHLSESIALLRLDPNLRGCQPVSGFWRVRSLVTIEVMRQMLRHPATMQKFRQRLIFAEVKGFDVLMTCAVVFESEVKTTH